MAKGNSNQIIIGLLIIILLGLVLVGWKVFNKLDEIDNSVFEQDESYDVPIITPDTSGDEITSSGDEITGNAVVGCTDSDGGKNIYVKGKITLNATVSYSDSCNGRTGIKEQYCKTATQGYTYYTTCPNRWDCLNGACKEPY